MADSSEPRVNKGGRPRKPPYGETPKRRWRTPVELDNLLAHCRARPGSPVLLELLPTAEKARNRAAQFRRRDNGPGVWTFTASHKDNLKDRRQYGVYGMYEEDVNGR